jgi:MinD-like ATPase involved in chromosome partitioning or flagellar assembly
MEKRIYVVVEADPNRSSAIAQQICHLGRVEEVHTQAELTALEQKGGPFHAWLVNPEVPPEMVARLRKKYQAPVFLIGHLPLSQLAAFYQAGIQDVFPFPFDPQWIKKQLTPDVPKVERPPLLFTEEVAVAKAPMDSFESLDPRERRQRIILVSSGKGGAGKTSFTAQLGMAMARKGLQPIAFDTDKQGNLARWIGEDSISSIQAFASEKMRKDRATLESLLAVHQKTGLKVLPSPLRNLDPIKPSTVEATLQAYKDYYSCLLFDLEQGVTPVFAKLAQNYATDIFLLTTPDLSRLERTKEMAHILLQQKISAQKIHVVVNKVKNKEDFQVVRAPLAELGLSVQALPFHQKLSDANEIGFSPLFQDPKSPYATQFKKLVKDTLNLSFGPSSGEGGKPKKPSSSKAKSSSLNAILSIFQRRK